MDPTIRALVNTQRTLAARKVKLLALSVDPEVLDKIQNVLASSEEDQEAAKTLAGIQFLPWYPELEKGSKVLSIVELITRSYGWLQEEGVNLRDCNNNQPQPDTLRRLLFTKLGIDYDKMLEEQADAQGRRQKA